MTDKVGIIRHKGEEMKINELEELRIPADDPAQWDEYERRIKEKDENPDNRDGGTIVIDL